MNTPINIRYIQIILFMTVYIALGFLLRLKAESYLLLGIPLTILFQLLIVRKPLHKLWLRDEEVFHLNRYGWLLTICFLAFPVYKILELAVQSKLTFVNLGYYSAAIAGAFCAGYCYSKLTKKTVKDFLLCFGLVALVRSAMYFIPFLSGQQERHADYIRGIKSLLIYTPIAFVVEEVIFRGMLDTYVHQSKNKNGFWSALFISCLWGLWHLPLSANSENPIWFVALASMTISLWGILLSIFWRRTGNLAVPGFSHAFADAIRDALQ